MQTMGSYKQITSPQKNIVPLSIGKELNFEIDFEID